jgi:hypothetical protein
MTFVDMIVWNDLSPEVMTSVTRNQTKYDEGQNLKHIHAQLYSTTSLSEVSGSSEVGETRVTKTRRCYSMPPKINQVATGLRMNSRGCHLMYISQWMKLGEPYPHQDISCFDKMKQFVTGQSYWPHFFKGNKIPWVDMKQTEKHRRYPSC